MGPGRSTLLPSTAGGSRRLNSSACRAGTQTSPQTCPQSCKQQDLGVRFSFRSACRLPTAPALDVSGRIFGAMSLFGKTSAQRRKGSRVQSPGFSPTLSPTPCGMRGLASWSSSSWAKRGEAGSSRWQPGGHSQPGSGAGLVRAGSGRLAAGESVSTHLIVNLGPVSPAQSQLLPVQKGLPPRRPLPALRPLSSA